MNSAKLVHILLIVLLCYGQVVSSVHAVEHFELAEDDDESTNGHHHHGDWAGLYSLHAANHQHPPHSVSDKKSADDNHAELDCEIYHAFQNLNGIGGAFLQPLPETTRRDNSNACALGYIVSDSLEIPQIRAPPVLI